MVVRRTALLEASSSLRIREAKSSLGVVIKDTNQENLIIIGLDQGYREKSAAVSFVDKDVYRVIPVKGEYGDGSIFYPAKLISKDSISYPVFGG